jgi:hypothetical protein
MTRRILVVRVNYCDHQENRKSVIGCGHWKCTQRAYDSQWTVHQPNVGLRAGSGLSRSQRRQLGSARSRFKRTVGVQHGVRKRCRSCAIFRPPTVSVATHTLTSGARRNGRRARDAGRSYTRLPKLIPTLVAWTAVLEGWRRRERGREGGGTQMPQCRFSPVGPPK